MRILYLVLTAAFAVIGIYMALRIRRDAARMRNWATVDGNVLDKSVGDPIAGGRTRALKIKYSYVVGGRTFVSERVDATGHVGYLPDDARAQLAALPSTVTVHYDPANPADAYLRDVPRTTYWLLIGLSIGLILAVLAQAVMLVGR